MLDVLAVRYLHDYVLWLRFDDGVEGEVDLAAELWGEVFEPLKDHAFFAKAFVNADTGTIEWPNHADFAPEFLRERVRLAV